MRGFWIPKLAATVDVLRMAGHDASDDLRSVIAELRDLLSALREDLAAAREVNERQSARIAQLEARLGRDSSNSSKPPSSDGPWSKRRHRRRPRSDKKQGAQPGHPGKTRKLVDPDQVDEVVDHEPQECSQCGHDEVLLGHPEPGSGSPSQRCAEFQAHQQSAFAATPTTAARLLERA